MKIFQYVLQILFIEISVNFTFIRVILFLYIPFYMYDIFIKISIVEKYFLVEKLMIIYI